MTHSKLSNSAPNTITLVLRIDAAFRADLLAETHF